MSSNPLFSLQHTHIDDSTLTAYMSTDYRVISTSPFTLKIGLYSPELKELCNYFEANCAAFLTAYNPYSQLLTYTENEIADRRLIDELDRLKLCRFLGLSCDLRGQWPDEASHLILDLTMEESIILAHAFDQNAFVWADEEAIPQLVLLK